MTFLLASLVFIADRITKMAVASNMSYGQSIKILPGILHFTFVLNNGTAFSLFKGANAALAFFSVVVIALIIFYLLTHKGLAAANLSALGLILGGALGNLYDRIRFGHVIDFLDLRVWPVFNVADSAITIGLLVLGWGILKQNFQLCRKELK